MKCKKVYLNPTSRLNHMKMPIFKMFLICKNGNTHSTQESGFILSSRILTYCGNCCLNLKE